VTLIDLSQPMLDRAQARVRPRTAGHVEAIQGDVRAVPLPEAQFDIILAAAVLHHLRTDQEWRDVLTALYRALRHRGSLWVFDLVDQEIPAVREIMWRRYGDYLAGVRDADYRDHVLAYVDKEDTPRSLTYQLDLLRQVGFAQLEVLHVNSCFAAFGALKS
jgi:tRNA (cmo5U34)-methyltransferase